MIKIDPKKSYIDHKVRENAVKVGLVNDISINKVNKYVNLYEYLYKKDICLKICFPLKKLWNPSILSVEKYTINVIVSKMKIKKVHSSNKKWSLYLLSSWFNKDVIKRISDFQTNRKPDKTP